MENKVVFEDAVKIVNKWLINNKSIFEKYDIEVDVRRCDDEEHFTIFGPQGDYGAELICGNSGCEPYRYIMFGVIQISMKQMIYYWDDNDIPLEDIETHLDNCMNVFINLVKSS